MGDENVFDLDSEIFGYSNFNIHLRRPQHQWWDWPCGPRDKDDYLCEVCNEYIFCASVHMLREEENPGMHLCNFCLGYLCLGHNIYCSIGTINWEQQSGL